MSGPSPLVLGAPKVKFPLSMALMYTRLPISIEIMPKIVQTLGTLKFKLLSILQSFYC